jgi:glycosyltransferase involved in cell wall biosynthesis
MSTPLVSIITPTYNHEKYIEACIESVLRQTLADWEMIIINDGSTDHTAGKIEKYPQSESRIKYIHQSNVGVFRLGETYNSALKLSTGKYIAILEGDDLWEPDKLLRQVTTLEKDSSIVLAWGKAQMVNSDLSVMYSEEPQTSYPDELYQNISPGSILELYMKGPFIPAVTIMVRRDYLEKIGGFIQVPGMPLVDFTTLMELSLLGRFYFDNHLLGKWRIYSTQTTKKYPVEIYDGIRTYLHTFLPRISSFDAAKKKAIQHHYDLLCLVAYARSGRYKLLRKEFKSARKDYIKALTYPIRGKPVWRIRALVGMGMSLLHLNVEWMAKLLGRKTYGG